MKKLISKFLPGGGLWSPGNVPSYRWQDNVSSEDKKVIEARLKADELALNDPHHAPLLPSKEVTAAYDYADILAKLKSLANLGYYGKAIDGKWGRGSKAAEEAATRAGYVWNGASYARPKALLSDIQADESAPHALTIGMEKMQSSWNGLKNSLSNALWIDHPLGSTKDVLSNAGSLAWNTGVEALSITPTGHLISSKMQDMYDNMYPYSYGDKLVNLKTGETLAYSGGDIPLGWALKLVSANDDSILLGIAAGAKIYNSAKEMDPRRAIMNQLADVDLNTAEGRSLWNNLSLEALKNSMVFFNGHTSLTPELIQWYLRTRLDNMSMYKDGTMKYNSYEVNPEYESNTAKARGAKTYRIANPEMRKKINLEMANYWLANARNAKWVREGEDGYKDAPFRITKDGKYIMLNMGYLGNLSMVADDIDGLNLVNGDWWDYIINDPNARAFYTADRLVPEGTRPTRLGTTGINHAHMTESADDLVKNMLKAAVEKASDTTTEAYNQGKLQVKNRLISR